MSIHDDGKEEGGVPEKPFACCASICPQAVLASVPDLECGFSRDLFVQWASNPRNSIILTMRPSLGCLARQLIENLKLTTLEMEVRRRVCLEGEELEAYRQKEREERMAKQQAEK